MSTISRTRPVARKPHRCTGCGEWILVGERYHRLVVNLGYEGLGTAKECARCCERYGRPIPQEA